MKRRSYIALATQPLAYRLQESVLAGSVTSCPIKVGRVTVDDFSAGFNIDGNDFKDISFD